MRQSVVGSRATHLPIAVPPAMWQSHIITEQLYFVKCLSPLQALLYPLFQPFRIIFLYCSVLFCIVLLPLVVGLVGGGLYCSECSMWIKNNRTL